MRKTKSVDIKLLHYCNFSCDYCIAGSQHREGDNLMLNDDGSIKIYPDNDFMKEDFTARMDYLRSNNLGHDRGHFLDLTTLYEYMHLHFDSDWTMVFGGGEPMYYPKFEYFLDSVIENWNSILLTNGSLLHSNSPILKSKNLNKLLFRVAFHPDQRSNESLLSKINILKSNGCKYIVNFILHPKYEKDNKHLDYIKFMRDNDISYEITRFEGEYDGVEYSVLKPMTQFEYNVLSGGRYTRKTELPSNTPGTSFYSIYGDGKVYACNGYRNSNIDSYIGYVYDMTLNKDFKSFQSCASKCEIFSYQDDLFNKYLK